MSKKTTIQLTAEQEALVKGFSAEEVKDFNALSDDEKVTILNELLALQVDSKKLDGQVETKDVVHGDEGMPLYIAGGLVIRKGMKFIAQYVGLQFAFSKEKKENWEVVTAEDGKSKYYRSSYFVFRRTDGTEFGIFKTPMMLKALRNLLTRSSGAPVDADPVVSFIYDGKVAREIAEKDYAFKMDTGTETHAWQIEVEKTAKFGTGRGILNLLNAPVPVGSGSDEDATQDEINMRNYRNLQKGIVGNSAPALENHAQAQLAQ